MEYFMIGNENFWIEVNQSRHLVAISGITLYDSCLAANETV